MMPAIPLFTSRKTKPVPDATAVVPRASTVASATRKSVFPAARHRANFRAIRVIAKLCQPRRPACRPERMARGGSWGVVPPGDSTEGLSVIDKFRADVLSVLDVVPSGASLAVGGFGSSGRPDAGRGPHPPADGFVPGAARVL